MTRPEAFRSTSSDLGPGAWTGRGAMAILDQALFAGSHFILNVLLARWLAPAEYGAFATAYSAFLLVAAFHHAVFVEPMMIFGAGKFSHAFRRYLRRLLRMHAVVLLPFALVAVGGAVWWIRVPDDPLAEGILGLAASGFFVLILNVLRRALFTQMRPGWSAIGGGVYGGTLLVTTLLLARLNHLSPLTALLAMGGAAFLTTCFLSRPSLRGIDGAGPVPEIDEITREHWVYGRWALATVLPIWVSSNVYYLLLPLLMDLQSVGEFRAIMNLAMPVLHTFMALSLILLPFLVRTRVRRGVEALKKPATTMLLLYYLGATAYFALLIPFGHQAVAFMYDGRYEVDGLLPILVLGSVPFATALISVFAAVLRAIERPDLVLIGHSTAAATAVLAGVVLISQAGVIGSLIAMFISACGGGIVMLGCYRVLTRGGAE